MSGGGFYISKAVAIGLGVFFVCSITLTAVLTYYIPSDSCSDEHYDNDYNQYDNRSLKYAGGESRASEFRLPITLKPDHYLVRLQPFINGNRSIHGYTEITFECVQSTTNVTLHILDIETVNSSITLVEESNPTGPGILFTSHTYDPVTNFYVGQLAEALQPGTKYIISMNFFAYLNDILVGFYLSQYEDDTENIVNLGTTQFQATDARRAFPCFDEPAMKANFTIEMAREDGLETISNMPRISTSSIPSQPGWNWDIFAESLPMSTYLVAFVVSDFLFVESNFHPDVLFRVWARPTAIDQTAYAIDKGPRVLSYLETYYQIPFPLPKQDMIALPDFGAGAMENWGLITYRETSLLYDPTISNAANKQRVVYVIAHELAHMWFGDLVTMYWWTDIWLNEGFASYVQYIGVEAVEPEMDYLKQFLNEELQYAFAIDSLESSHPISIPVEHPDEISEIFDAISYSKGASIIRMMNHFLTEGTFTQGVTNYLNEFAYGNAAQDDLWQALTDQAHTDGTLNQNLTVKEIMDTWTLQMGFPVVMVYLNVSGEALLTQERFLLDELPNYNDTHIYTWWIPINYASETNPDFTQTGVMAWMKDTDTSIVIPNLPTGEAWFIFNVRETGYYRVNYEADNWEAIIDQLNADHTAIDAYNRAQIMDDTLNLARGDFIPYDVPLDATLYLKKESDYVTWVSSLRSLEYIEQMLTRETSYGALKDYLLDILIPMYDAVGFDDSMSDQHVIQLQRSLALEWTCHLGHSPCVTNSTDLYSQWMAAPTDNSIISPNQRDAVYCTAMEEGGEAEWNFAYSAFLQANVGNEIDKLLYSMACSEEIWILQRYLDITFTTSSDIRKQDAYKVYNGIAGSDLGRDLAWDYLRTEWDMLLAYYDGSASQLASFANEASYEFNTQAQLAELTQLRDSHLDELGTATQEFDQAIERTQINIAWMEDHHNEIVDWLADNSYVGPAQPVS